MKYGKIALIGVLCSLVSGIITVYGVGLAKQVEVQASSQNEEFVELSFQNPESLPKHISVNKNYQVFILSRVHLIIKQCFTQQYHQPSRNVLI